MHLFENNIAEDEQGELPLHESVFRGNWKKFKNLLNKGYDVTKKDKHGELKLLNSLLFFYSVKKLVKNVVKIPFIHSTFESTRI